MYNVETPKKIHDCIHMFFRASSYQIIYDIAHDFFLGDCTLIRQFIQRHLVLENNLVTKHISSWVISKPFLIFFYDLIKINDVG